MNKVFIAGYYRGCKMRIVEIEGEKRAQGWIELLLDNFQTIKTYFDISQESTNPEDLIIAKWLTFLVELKENEQHNLAKNLFFTIQGELTAEKIDDSEPEIKININKIIGKITTHGTFQNFFVLDLENAAVLEEEIFGTIKNTSKQVNFLVGSDLNTRFLESCDADYDNIRIYGSFAAIKLVITYDKSNFHMNFDENDVQLLPYITDVIQIS